MSDYKLWGRAGWGSTLVEAQLAWYGLPFTFEPVGDLFKTPDARAKLEKVNPLAQVPTLVMPDGSVMSESAAITLLLADITGKDLLVPPAGAPERAAFLRWLVFIVANIYPTFTYADDPARFVSVNAARDPFRAATDAYAQRLWRQVETASRQPVVPGRALLGARHLRLGVMTRWRPKRGWFESETPQALRHRPPRRPGARARPRCGSATSRRADRRMASVGIVGGLGVGATVHYYEKITAACKARGVVPDLAIVHADVDKGQGFVREGRLDALADYLAGFIERLERAGAQAAVLPAVTPHICIAEPKRLAPCR